MTTYIGIDLAWSAKNGTGAMALVGDGSGGAVVREVTLLRSDADIVAFIVYHAGAGPAVVAVDAPLLVPNATGRRPAEDALARAFRRYEAGPYPANRSLLARGGVVRGEALVEELRGYGFVYHPMISPDGPPRQVSEVFPHPASVVLFGLERTLKYKARRNRPLAERLDAFRAYQRHLLALAEADPPLRGHQALLAADPAALALAQLKGYEDRLDALLCAYIALYGHRWGAARCQVFGDDATGAIFTPVSGGGER